MTKLRSTAAALAGMIISASLFAGSPPAAARDTAAPDGYAQADAATDSGHRPEVQAQRPAPTGYPVRGIDVSSHDHAAGKTIDWAAEAANGLSFAYIKATEGSTYLNPYFDADYHAAKNNNVMAGAYAYARPDNPDPTGQADFFYNKLQLAFDGRTMVPFVDIEWPYRSGGSYVAPWPCYGLTQLQMATWLHTFLNELGGRIGRPPMIYTSASWWNHCVGTDPSFGGYPLDVSSCAATPRIPTGWSTWALWQHNIPGCDSTLPRDADVFRGSLSEMSGSLVFAASGNSGGNASCGEAVCTSARPGGIIDTFWRRSDHNLGHWYLPTSGLPSETLGGTMTSSPTSVSHNDGVDVFWRAADGGLGHLANTGNAWTGPENLGGAGTIVTAPRAVAQPGGTVDVFWRGADSRLWHVAGSRAAGWGVPASLGYGPLDSDPTVSTNNRGTLDVFWKGVDKGLWHAWFVPGFGWNGPQNLGGTGFVTNPPRAVGQPSGTVDVFWKGPDGNLWHAWAVVGVGWRSPIDQGNGPLGSDPSVTSDGAGHVDVFWAGTDRALWHSGYAPGGRWSTAQSLGGAGDVPSTPSSASQPTGLIDLFWKGPDGNLWHAWGSPTIGWHPPIPQTVLR